jgi:hypothetical protein
MKKGFSIQDYLEKNKIELGSIKKEVGSSVYKGGHNDLRKTSYDVNIKDGKFQLDTHKTVITENKKRTISEGIAKSFLGGETRRVEKGGGNSENLIGYGLPDVANQLDTYSSGTDMIYTKKTIELFKKFVESMATDEINNNQPNP